MVRNYVQTVRQEKKTEAEQKAKEAMDKIQNNQEEETNVNDSNE